MRSGIKRHKAAHLERSAEHCSASIIGPPQPVVAPGFFCPLTHSPTCSLTRLRVWRKKFIRYQAVHPAIFADRGYRLSAIGYRRLAIGDWLSAIGPEHGASRPLSRHSPASGTTADAPQSDSNVKEHAPIGRAQAPLDAGLGTLDSSQFLQPTPTPSAKLRFMSIRQSKIIRECKPQITRPNSPEQPGAA